MTPAEIAKLAFTVRGEISVPDEDSPTGKTAYIIQKAERENANAFALDGTPLLIYPKPEQTPSATPSQILRRDVLREGMAQVRETLLPAFEEALAAAKRAHMTVWNYIVGKWLKGHTMRTYSPWDKGYTTWDDRETTYDSVLSRWDNDVTTWDNRATQWQ